MKHRNRGFTLVELMIVIAILAIVLSIAIPAYQIFSVRARVAEGLNMAAAAKFAVADSFVDQGAVPDQAATGYDFGGPTEYVAGIRIAGDGSGTITVTTRNTGARPDIVVLLEPRLVAGRPIQWNCRLARGGPRYVPASCRD